VNNVHVARLPGMATFQNALRTGEQLLHVAKLEGAVHDKKKDGTRMRQHTIKIQTHLYPLCT
jgi:hypothetical protein